MNEQQHNVMAPIDKIAAEMDSMSNEQIIAVIRDALTITVEQLRRIAGAVRVLERRGYDLSELRLSMMQYVRRIAHGQLLPDLVVELQGHSMLLRRVAALPLPDQERLLRDGAVEIAEPGDHDDVRRVPLKSLSRDEIYQAFGADGEIRDPIAQVAYLRGRQPARQRSLRQPAGDGDMVVDAKKGGVNITGPMFLSRRQLAQLLARLEDAI